jgi:predicted dinucleotide-binding enzyme
MLSSRHPEKLKGLAESIGKNAYFGLPAQASGFGNVVVLSVPWTQAADALKSAGSLEGKVLIDCTNPLKSDLSGLVLGHTTSAAEEVAKMSPGSKVVKAFNTTFASVMHSPSRMFGSQRATGFYCGDDSSAKTIVSGLIRETGLEPLDVGPLMCARYLEPLAMLAMQIAFGQGFGTEMALGFLKR